MIGSFRSPGATASSRQSTSTETPSARASAVKAASRANWSNHPARRWLRTSRGDTASLHGSPSPLCTAAVPATCSIRDDLARERLLWLVMMDRPEGLMAGGLLALVCPRAGADKWSLAPSVPAWPG